MTHRRLRSTLADILDRSSDARLVFHLDGGRVQLSGDELAARAEAGAATLARLGIGPGDRVGLLGPNRPEWAVWAFAVWQAGAVLVQLSFPLRIRDRGAFAERLDAVVSAAGCRLVLADPALLDTVPRGLGRSWHDVPTGGLPGRPEINPEDPAVVQFTSGSTASPKGVELSHGAIVAAVTARAEVQRIEPGRSVVGGWVPLFHDLGLFFHLVMPALAGAESHFLPTERFARDPGEWFRMLSDTRATTTSGSTSGWSAALRAVDGRATGIDLGAMVGGSIAAEMIDCEVLDRVRDRGPAIGLRPEAVCGGYGLAEFTLTATANPPGHGTRIETLDADALTAGRAVHGSRGPVKRIASCGPAIPGAQIRIAVDGDPASERHVGEILLQGPSMMSGYVGSEESPITGGWLHTGDLGYLADGELYVTGRITDMVIVMGQNHYPEDFEWAAGRVDGVRAGRCVAFGHPHRDEQIVLLVEPSRGADLEALPGRVREAAGDVVAPVPTTVLVLEPGTVEKTTSGKLRRQAMREAFARGDLRSIATR